MNDRRSSSDLGSSAEATLGTFPFPDRDWENDARAIEARITSGLPGSTDALLLAAPLPGEADEPSALSATATPLTNSGVRTQSLAELARRSVEKKQAQERQMARESLALAAQQRARTTQSGEQSALTRSNGTVTNGAAASTARVNHVASSSIAQDRAAHSKAKSFPKVALALPALALAAAAVFWFRHPEPAPLLSNEVAPAAPSAIAASPRAADAIAHEQPTARDDLPRGVDPSSLPEQASPPQDPSSPSAASGAVAASAPGKVAAVKPALKAAAASAETKGGDQGMPPDPALRPADSRGGELPMKPTTGAVQAALGSVMSGARHCVAGDDAASSAVVVFGSDGRVQHVTVSGAAAGKSSAACIEAQLSRARVQPFAAASFSVNATVRPE